MNEIKYENLPEIYRQAVDLGLVEIQNNKLVQVSNLDCVPQVAKLVEKIRPELHQDLFLKSDQEAIVLSRVLSSSPDDAREKWAILRQALGVKHKAIIPPRLWSNEIFAAISNEIDQIYLGRRAVTELAPNTIIKSYGDLGQELRKVSMVEFNSQLAELAEPGFVEKYGHSDSQYEIAIDVLRADRMKAISLEMAHNVQLAGMAGFDPQKLVDYMHEQVNLVDGLAHGEMTKADNITDFRECLIGTADGPGLIDLLTSTAPELPHYTTGSADIDADMEGGIRHCDDTNTDGRIFVLAARTGVGKTVIGCSIAARAAIQGCQCGYVSVELGESQINARLGAAMSYHLKARRELQQSIKVSDLLSPSGNTEHTAQTLLDINTYLLNVNGNVLVEAPWQSDVDSVCLSIRMMKAKRPKLRFVVIDHFHCMGRHKGAPSDTAAMLEERAYKLTSIAKELDLDLLVLAQMNRVGMDERLNAEPSLEQIRGTDALSHVAHAVWIVKKSKEQPEARFGEVAVPQLEIHHVKRRGGQAIWQYKGEVLEKTYEPFNDAGKLNVLYSNSAFKDSIFR
jgi:hypothetical protein